MLLRAVVVDDEVNIQLCWDRGLNTAQKTHKLLVPVPRLARVSTSPVAHVKAGEQGGDAEADVGRDTLGNSGPWAAAAESCPGPGSASSRRQRAGVPCKASPQEYGGRAFLGQGHR